MVEQIVTVVIPTHLPEPTLLNQISLAQTLKVLGQHPITFVVPEGLDTRWYEEFCRGKAEISFERFSWEGHREFSRLMLSPDFYDRFLSYRYILICHLDAFVFKNDLDAWCERGYDYVGSVIYDRGWESGLPVSRRKNLVNAFLRRSLGIQRTEYFANGGFALMSVLSTSSRRSFDVMSTFIGHSQKSVGAGSWKISSSSAICHVCLAASLSHLVLTR
jgi:hypothetical protein